MNSNGAAGSEAHRGSLLRRSSSGYGGREPRGIFAEPSEAKNAIMSCHSSFGTTEDSPCGKPEGFLAKEGDRAIIERVRLGDINAFTELLTRYRAWVFAIVLKHVPQDRAEELAHDIFVEAYKALPTYRGTAEFRHWLAGIAVRQCFTFWRRASRQPVCCVLKDLSNETQTWLDRASRAVSQEIFDQQTNRQAARELLDYALNRLSAEDRTLVTLFHLEERSVREVARLMAWSPMNVKVRAYRARQRMRRIIEQLLKHEESHRENQ